MNRMNANLNQVKKSTKMSDMDTTLIDQALVKIRIVADCIKEVGGIPSGHLYAMVMGYFTLKEYEKIIEILINAGLIKKKNHLLTWLREEK